MTNIFKIFRICQKGFAREWDGTHECTLPPPCPRSVFICFSKGMHLAGLSVIWRLKEKCVLGTYKLVTKHKPITSFDGLLRNSHLFVCWQRQIYPEMNEEWASEARPFICTATFYCHGRDPRNFVIYNSVSFFLKKNFCKLYKFKDPQRFAHGWMLNWLCWNF